MADILSQAEIESLLDINDQDLGSENFKKLYNEYGEWINSLQKGQKPLRFGYNPEEILLGLETDNKLYLETIKNYKEFQKFHKKFLKIAEDEPEIFI
jgi:hypothetical protein